MENYKSGIDELTEEFELTREEVIDLYSVYLVDTREYINNIEALYEKGFWKELQLVIHTIKGMAANLRLDDVFSESNALNKYLKDGKIPSIEIIRSYIELLEMSQKKISYLFSEDSNW